MKEVKIVGDEELEEYGLADWKDVHGLLEQIDEKLKPFGLELVLGDRGDDNWYVKIEESEKREVEA